VSPSDDFTVADVAALLDSDWAQAAAAIRRLTAAHLVRPCHLGRYVTHDLIRLYAAEMSHREDTEAERVAAGCCAAIW
jgi:hypothetical protein